MLNPNLSEPLQVLHKLEREMHRSFHHKNYVHKSDHFYNFCITALSLKDYVLHYLNKKSRADKRPYYDEWSDVDCLKAATEVANTSKHCVLENSPKTKSIERTKSNVINVLINDNGEIRNIEEIVPDYKITLSDGCEMQLFEFTREIIEYWKNYLASIDIKYVAQDEETFLGDNET